MKEAAQFNVTTFMGQGAVGYIAGTFVVVLIETFLIKNDTEAILFVPLLLFLGGLIGAPAGAVIWAGWEHPNRLLNRIGGVVMGVTVVALAEFFFLFLLNWPLQRWLFETILLAGIGIGLVTGSRLRPGHELVRVSDRVGPVLGVFAGLCGFVLRMTVALLFMVSCIALICIQQSSYYQRIDRVWSIVAFAHFTAALVLLFARIRIELLLPLAVIVNLPVGALLLMPPQYDELILPVSICYSGLWASFLLTNWRQTPVAFSFLREEFRYYLID
ncbi:MAG TPA: hypothetical protein VJS13_00070 [Pyrinomonadaceae bacterium]|nr:hypothetical protein [Pyrinomonadaceae bacterium]